MRSKDRFSTWPKGKQKKFLQSILRIPLRRGEEYKPWLAVDTIKWLEERLNKNMVMLEFGGGNSTIWFAKRVQHVYCWENDSNWSVVIQGWVRKEGLTNVTMVPVEDPVPDAKVDFVLIDNDDFDKEYSGKGNMHRMWAVSLVLDRITKDGIVGLDDDVCRNNVARKLLLESGWVRFKLTGIEDKHLTGFYRRKDEKA